MNQLSEQIDAYLAGLEAPARCTLEELRRTMQTAATQAEQVGASLAQGRLELQALESGTAHEGLQELLERRTTQEVALSDARHELDQVAQQLRAWMQEDA